MSKTGVSGRASMSSISTTEPFTDSTRQRLNAIRFGRTGARVAKTPRSGLAGSPRGWTCRMARCSGVSLRSNQGTAAGARVALPVGHRVAPLGVAPRVGSGRIGSEAPNRRRVDGRVSTVGSHWRQSQTQAASCNRLVDAARATFVPGSQHRAARLIHPTERLCRVDKRSASTRSPGNRALIGTADALQPAKIARSGRAGSRSTGCRNAVWPFRLGSRRT